MRVARAGQELALGDLGDALTGGRAGLVQAAPAASLRLGSRGSAGDLQRRLIAQRRRLQDPDHHRLAARCRRAGEPALDQRHDVRHRVRTPPQHLLHDRAIGVVDERRLGEPSEVEGLLGERPGEQTGLAALDLDQGPRLPTLGSVGVAAPAVTRHAGDGDDPQLGALERAQHGTAELKLRDAPRLGIGRPGVDDDQGRRRPGHRLHHTRAAARQHGDLRAVRTLRQRDAEPSARARAEEGHDDERLLRPDADQSRHAREQVVDPARADDLGLARRGRVGRGSVSRCHARHPRRWKNPAEPAERHPGRSGPHPRLWRSAHRHHPHVLGPTGVRRPRASAGAPSPSVGPSRARRSACRGSGCAASEDPRPSRPGCRRRPP
ncbi:hypothetical protein ACH61_02922 [Rathayibacter tanaceti]|uniref:Uncharacterized protein n=1 Tax=Rathayibacter tanaceti TaxID=1671680 RepID=A0A166H5J3_9MICO|nr:hypothetical protein ACH61_02922 [Rathayibacter tanaceti]